VRREESNDSPSSLPREINERVTEINESNTKWKKSLVGFSFCPAHIHCLDHCFHGFDQFEKSQILIFGEQPLLCADHLQADHGDCPPVQFERHGDFERIS
jgi:hypothetical protein